MNEVMFKQQKMIRWLAFVLFGVLALLGHGKAYAAPTCNSPIPSSFTFAVPTGSYGIPRDVPVGTVLTPWTAWQSSATSLWACDYQSGVYIGAALKALIGGKSVKVIGVTTGVGSSFPAYPTGVPGVGLIVQTTTNVGNGGTVSRVQPLYSSWQAPLSQIWYADGPGFTAGFSMKFAFVKTGPMTSGTTMPFGAFASGGVDNAPPANPVGIVSVNLTGVATFNVLACTTPDVLVDLGTQRDTLFTGVGSTSPAVSFNIKLNSCPAGMNTVQYSIAPTTTVVDSSQSVVALDASSNATGVGVQLLNSDGVTALPLSSNLLFSSYSGATGGDYAIPLKARYYQTGSSVGAGRANTSMVFTMTYL
ncbi:fimbrial protein [Luteibacter sp.]|uniref:fimbrial protein n=1 Tax=Luteibacter sp. TaxID=1886636 RepID=UPI0028095970|nr:fimbrial protein [Luteibacter sp.]MDQ8051192.1 fimbrial protein [Luteibacter sp.]